MNWIDWMALVVGGVLAFWGLSNGFIQMIIHLAIVVIALAFSSRLAPVVGGLFSGVTDNEDLPKVLAFIIIFVALFIVGGVVSFFARLFIGIIPFAGLPNRIGGMLVGIFLGFLLLSGILTAVQRFPVGDIAETIDDSKLGAFLADNFDVVIRTVGLIPGGWDDKLDKLSK